MSKFKNIIQIVEATNGVVKFATATFPLVEVPDFNIKV